MNTIKINITKDPKFGYSNLSFSEKPTEEMLQELKNNGWYYSKHFNRWYPATVEAKKNAESFAQDYYRHYTSEEKTKTIKTAESLVDLNSIENAVDAYISEYESEMKKGNYNAFIEVQEFVKKNSFITPKAKSYINRFIHSIEDIKGVTAFVAYGNGFYSYDTGVSLISELNKKIENYESIKNNPGQNDYSDLLKMIKDELKMLDNSRNKGTLFSVLQKEGDSYEQKNRRSNERNNGDGRTDYSGESGNSLGNKVEEQRSVHNSDKISDPAGHSDSKMHDGLDSGRSTELEANGTSADIQRQRLQSNALEQEKLSETDKVNDSTRDAGNGTQNLSEGRVEVYSAERKGSIGERRNGLNKVYSSALYFDVKNDEKLEQKVNAAKAAPMKDLFQRELNLKLEQSEENKEDYIHSQEFISNFGDWEKIARLEKLSRQESIFINGNEIAESDDLKEYKKNAISFGKNLTGSYTNDDTGNEILLTASKKNGGIFEILEHDYKDKEHLQSIAAIPQIIQKSIYITSEKNEDVLKHSNVVSYDYYVCGLKIGETEYTVKAVISNMTDGKRYYDHKLSTIEKGRLIDNLSQLTSHGKSIDDRNESKESSVSISTQTPDSILSETKDIRLLQICQPLQKEYLDENYKPTIETVNAVRTGKLYIEKDSNGFQTLHDLRTDRIVGKELSDLFVISKDKTFTIFLNNQKTSKYSSKAVLKEIREQCREILKKPDNEITNEDKLLLAQYEGAGGLNEENRTISGILNEFYTPNNLVEKVWQVVDTYAPEAKTVLEPSAGVGKFANNRPNNTFTMHELDETSARINKILHPEANVIQGAYQKQFFDAGERIHIPQQKAKYDVVIGNPPYGAYNDKYKGLGEGKEFDRYEEYFISKGLDALKDENSVMAYVVPSGFLNTASDKQKEILASKGKLIDAYRLPVGVFPTTEVGTDIIIMRTWDKERNELQKNWDSQGRFLTIDEAIKAEQKGHVDLLSNGEWFRQHPEKILGEIKKRTNRFGKEEEYVAVHEGLTIQDELNKIEDLLPDTNKTQITQQAETVSNEKEQKPVTLSIEELSLAKSVIPEQQFITTLSLSKGEEGDFFKQKIKDIANAVSKAPKLYETDGAEQHALLFRYFHPAGTESLVCEIGENGKAFGFHCINGDYINAEWGYIDLNELKTIPEMQLDYHVPEEMSIERWLYKEQPEMFPEYAKFAEQSEKTPFDIAKKDIKTNYVLEKLSKAGIEFITDKEEFDRILVRENLLQKMAKSKSEKYLNTEDIKMLKSMGYKKDDFEQIQLAILVSDIKLNGKKTSVKKAVEVLGRKDFLSGISRSATHWSSERVNGENIVSFDSENMFNRSPGGEEYVRFHNSEKEAKEHIEFINELVRQESYFTFDEEDSTKFVEHINEWHKDNTNPSKLIVVGKVTPVMKVLGISEKLIEVEQATLDKMLRDAPLYPNDKQGHKLTIDDIYAIPSQLADPVMVFKSRTRNDSYVFFTERKDPLNRSILIPLAIDKRKGRIVIHEITSMYGRNNEIDFVKSNIDENNLIYEDRKRSCLWAKGKVEELNELNRKNSEKKLSPNGERFTQIQFLGQRFTDNGTYRFNILTKERLVNFLSSQNTKVQNFIQDNTTYGFAHNGKIYLNPDVMNSEAAVHEYTHLWDTYTQRTNPELWQKGLNIFKGTSLWNDVVSDVNYADIKDDENLVLSECHARICGKIADSVLQKVLERDGDLKQAEMIDWDKEVDQYIYENFESSRTLSDGRAIKSTGYGAFGTVVDVNAIRSWFAAPMKDLFQRELNLKLEQYQRKVQSVSKQEINPVIVENTSEQTHSESVAESVDDKSLREYDDSDGLFKNKKILSMQEFSKFYTGNNFDEKDYNIWANTDYRGIVNTASLSAEEKEYLKTSGKYVEPEPGIYTNAMLYATGKIYEKLDELEKQKENLSSESYEKCKSILEKAVPELYPMSKIQMDVLSPLAEEFTVTRTVTRKQWDYGAIKNVTSDENLNLKEDFLSWCTGYLQPDSENTRTYIQDFSVANVSREEIPENISFNDIAAYVDRIPVNTGISEDDTKEERNAKLTVAGAKKDARKETAYKLFNRYLQTGLSAEEKEQFCLFWNKIYNGTVQADYKKLPLFIDGMSTYKGREPFKLYKQQIEGINRLVSKGNGLLAYGVGVGKTAAGICASIAQMQSKRAKRPLIICPNQVYKKWVRDLRELFPNVTINELGNLSDPFLEANHYDESTHSLIIPENSVSVMTDSALQKITFTDKACEKYLAKDFGCVLGLSAELESDNDRDRANALQKIQNLVGKASRIKAVKVPGDNIARETEIQQSYVFFDRCNWDNICVDEAHKYKNLFVIPRAKKGDKKQANEFEGIGSAAQSRRALKMFGMTTIIQQQNENRNVFLLTATPFTNNPLEVYSMLSFMARKELLDRHIYDVRDFCTEFALTKNEYAVTPDGDIKPKNVMKAFKGQKKLHSLITEFIDSKSAEDAGIPKPEGERHAVFLELTDLQQAIINYNEAAIKNASGKDGVVLRAMTHMRTATLSPALLDPDDYPGLEIPPLEQVVECSPKLKYECDTVADVYKHKPECGQFIYMPQGVESFQYVKEYLIKQGVPEEAIEYVSGKHNNTNKKKQKVADRFNDKEDKLKILIGSSNVAEGIDLNGNSICCYNTMLGWNPTESVQVEGRIWRQGNEQGKVHIYYPLMEDSIDALIYQKHDEKASRINSIFKENENDQDTIDVSEIDPETVKFELIKDPVKKVDMLIEQDTAEFKKELKILENRTETINDLVKAYGIIKNMIAEQKSEHEKYSELVKQYRENLKNIPENDSTRWQHEGKLEAAAHTRDVAYKELQKGNARMNSIMTNFMRMDIKVPETEAAIKLEEIARKKQAVLEKIESIEKSKDKRIEEEQIKLLQKKLVAKPLEQQRKETVEYILKNTWYKTTEEKDEPEKPVVKDASITTEPITSIPIELEERFNEALEKKDFKVLSQLCCWGDRNSIKENSENNAAIKIFCDQFEKKYNIGLPSDIRDRFITLVNFCDPETLPEEYKFKDLEEAISYELKDLNSGTENSSKRIKEFYEKKPNVNEFANFLKEEYGTGGHSFIGYDHWHDAKGIKLTALINGKKKSKLYSWNEIASRMSKIIEKSRPRVDFEIMSEEKRKSFDSFQQQDLFGFEELNPSKVLEYGEYDEIGFTSKFINANKGLLPVIKEKEDVYKVYCKGKDIHNYESSKDIYIHDADDVEISVSKNQLQNVARQYIQNKVIENIKSEYEDCNFKKKKIAVPKLSEITVAQKDVFIKNGIKDENEMLKMYRETYKDVLLSGEKPIFVAKKQDSSVSVTDSRAVTEEATYIINDDNIGY